MHPLPRTARSFSVSTRDLEETHRFLHAIQNSKLAHTALQARFESSTELFVDILFEGTDAGLSAQEAHLKVLAEKASVSEASPDVWNTRQGLWSFSRSESAAIAKISLLPAEIERSVATIAKSADARQLEWKAVVQATGIGWLRLEGDSKDLHISLQELREQFERNTGSLVLLHRPDEMPAIDAWGNAGDALPLMKAVKQQLDPRSTLNPSRFVGGI